MGRNLTKLFRNKDQEMLRVPIFVNDANNSLMPTELTCPTGEEWGKFDYIEWIVAGGGGSSNKDMETLKIDKERLTTIEC